MGIKAILEERPWFFILLEHHARKTYKTKDTIV